MPQLPYPAPALQMWVSVVLAMLPLVINPLWRTLGQGKLYDDDPANNGSHGNTIWTVITTGQSGGRTVQAGLGLARRAAQGGSMGAWRRSVRRSRRRPSISAPPSRPASLPFAAVVVAEPNMGGAIRKGTLRALGAVVGGGLGMGVLALAGALCCPSQERQGADLHPAVSSP